MPWDVLEQKRADHTYNPDVRSSSGPASLHPGQSIKREKHINTLFAIRHSQWSVTFPMSSLSVCRFHVTHTTYNIIYINKLFFYIASGEMEKKGPIFFRRKKDAQHFFLALGRKKLRLQNRVLRCPQPASRPLLRKTAILPPILNVAPAQQRNS